MSQHHSPFTQGANYHKRFLMGIVLNVLLVVIQVLYGLKANSVALVSDGLHNATDVFSLAIAWVGFHLANLKTSSRFTYGFKNTTILAAFINAILLFIAVGGITWEAVKRVLHPELVHSEMVIIVALLGVVINGLTATFFLRGTKDINLRGAFLHLMMDAAVSLGVVVASIGILLTQWLWLDPAMSLLISFAIVWGSWGLFKESTRLMLQAVPAHINLDEVKDYLLSRQKVVGVHDLHIWALSSSDNALSVHLILSDIDEQNVLLQQISNTLKAKYQINHSTIQFETPDNLLKCEISCES